MSDTRTPRKAKGWTGDSVINVPKIIPVVADTIQLVDTLADIQGQKDVTHKTTYLTFHIRRLAISTVDGLQFVVWLGKTLLATSTPSQPQVPLSGSRFDHADKDIMLTGGLPVPACLIDSVDALAISREVLVVEREVRSMRQFSRANHGIFLQIQSSVDSAVSIRVTWRTIYLT